MSLFSGSTKSTSTGTQSPTNPTPVTNGIIDFTKLIASLGGQDPQKYVTGPSNLQNMAFGMGAGIAGRYGMGVPQGQPGGYASISPNGSAGMMFGPNGPQMTGGGEPGKAMVNGGSRTGSPDTGMPGTVGKKQYTSEVRGPFTEGGGATSPQPPATGQGLYDSLGVQREPDLNPQQLAPGNFTPDPGLRQGWERVRGRPQDQNYVRSTGGDYDNNGSISEQEYYNWHRSQFNDRDSYQPAAVAPQQPAGSTPATGGQGGGGNPYVSQVGYTAANMGNNPVAQYGEAADITRGVANSGGNFAQMQGLGSANMYGPSGPANVGGYGAAGPANVGGYNAAQVGQTPQIDPVTNASAARGIQFSQPYENRFIDQVVNTSLAGFDEYAGRQRAQEAAQAAGNNAFGGSRYGVQRAITEEQVARERASTESGLRFGAQDRAFGLGMQDAGMETQASMANAAAANQRAQAQAGMDLSRLMANMGAQNDASQFGANARNTAAMDFTGRTDQASAFGADATNRAALDFAGRADQAGQFNAGSQNQFDLTRFAAGNDMSRFNAGQADTAMARRLAAGGQLGDLAGAQAGNERADLAMLQGLGAQEREINQQGATADLRLMELMAQLYGTMPYGLFNGQNTSGTQRGTTTPSAIDSAQSALNLGSSVAAIFSDRRVKTDIIPMGKRSGLNWYRFRYITDPPTKVREGVMAQEVMQTRPDAVTTADGGTLMVNYGKLFGKAA